MFFPPSGIMGCFLDLPSTGCQDYWKNQMFHIIILGPVLSRKPFFKEQLLTTMGL
jgi:hypothetical protein